MYRASLVAIASLFLSAALVAQEAQSELDTVAVQIMVKAYQVADYDTVETLFHKLSLENKKQFLKEAIETTESMLGEMPSTTMDAIFYSLISAAGTDQTPAVLGQYVEQKRYQTQLLGRLTLSLFEAWQQSAALQGQGILAQGNALGETDTQDSSRPTGAMHEGNLALTGRLMGGENSDSQGVALGYYAPPLQGDSYGVTIPSPQRPKGATVTRTYYIGDMITGYVGDTGIQHLTDIVTAVVEPDSIPAQPTCTGLMLSRPASIKSFNSGATPPQQWSCVLTFGAISFALFQSRSW
jgi:hypothetical protein